MLGQPKLKVWFRFPTYLTLRYLAIQKKEKDMGKMGTFCGFSSISPQNNVFFPSYMYLPIGIFHI